jgi:hypothetical protein
VNEDDLDQLTGMLVSPFMNLQNRLWKEVLGVKHWLRLCDERKNLPDAFKYGYNLSALSRGLSVLLGLHTRILSSCSSLKSSSEEPDSLYITNTNETLFINELGYNPTDKYHNPT